jgi:hypothetical protein
MKRLLTFALVLTSFLTNAQTGYITENGRRVTYKVTEGKIIYSTGRVATPSIASTDFKKAYATATIPVVVVPPVVVPPVIIPPVVVPPVVTVPTTDTRPVVNMVIPANKQIYLGDISNKRIVIAKGTLNYLNVGKAVNCAIDLTGVDMPNGSIDIAQASGLEIFGATMHDVKYRCININGLSSGIYLHDISFKNVGNYVIGNYSKVYWDGTDATTANNWKFDKLLFDNTSTCFQSDASLDAKGVKNLLKNFSFTNSTIKNCPNIANSIVLGACDGYTFAYNTFTNLNELNNNDNGTIYAVGTGSVYNNTLTNHEGYLIRSRTMSFGPEVKSVLMYNNFIYNSRKYSALEVQTTPEMKTYIDKYPKWASVAKSEAYGNIAGVLSTSGDWAGVLFVAYNTYSTIDVHDNYGFAFWNQEKDPALMIHGMNDPVLTPLKSTNNIYYKTYAEALSRIPGLPALMVTAQ